MRPLDGLRGYTRIHSGGLGSTTLQHSALVLLLLLLLLAASCRQGFLSLLGLLGHESESYFLEMEHRTVHEIGSKCGPASQHCLGCLGCLDDLGLVILFAVFVNPSVGDRHHYHHLLPLKAFLAPQSHLAIRR